MDQLSGESAICCTSEMIACDVLVKPLKNEASIYFEQRQMSIQDIQMHFDYLVGRQGQHNALMNLTNLLALPPVNRHSPINFKQAGFRPIRCKVP